MIWKCYLCLAMVVGAESFLIGAVGPHQKGFRKVSVFQKPIHSGTAKDYFLKIEEIQDLSTKLE